MREIIKTEKAPLPVGPYSQAIAADGIVYCSGQIGLDPSTGKLVDGVKQQAETALRNLEAILAASGCSLADIVKTTVFVTDITMFKDVNEVYSRFFPADPPARSTVAVAALPLRAQVEIEAVAYRRRSGP
jgi:2-iminobutanoate/2-iminopropanoate deaminase